MIAVLLRRLFDYFSPLLTLGNNGKVLSWCSWRFLQILDSTWGLSRNKKASAMVSSCTYCSIPVFISGLSPFDFTSFTESIRYSCICGLNFQQELFSDLSMHSRLDDTQTNKPNILSNINPPPNSSCNKIPFKLIYFSLRILNLEFLGNIIHRCF